MNPIYLDKEEAASVMQALQDVSSDVVRAKNIYSALDEEFAALKNQFQRLMAKAAEISEMHQDQMLDHVRLLNGVMKHFMEPNEMSELSAGVPEPLPLVYFLKCRRSKRIKIGTTKKLSSRRNAIERERGMKLEVMKTVPGSYMEEALLHRVFSAIRTEGEWFKATSELEDFVDNLDPYMPLKTQFVALGLRDPKGALNV